jgi:AAA domain
MATCIAFTGTHATGKTTSVYEKVREIKLRLKDKTVGIVTENAMFSPYPINKETTRESQLWIFTNQIQAEISLLARYDVVISDRTAVDSIAYTEVAGFHDLAQTMLDLVKHHIHIYDEIYFKRLTDNNYLIEDGVREGKSKEFQQEVEAVMLALYEELGMLSSGKFFYT